MTVPTFEPVSLAELLLRLFPLGHISVSTAKQFAKCPEQARRRKVLGHKAAPSGAMVWGSADHEAAGFNYQQKIDSEKDLPVAEVQEFFAADLERRLGEEEVLWDSAEFRGKSEAKNVALVKDKGVQMVANYHANVAHDLYPGSVEQEFLLDVDGLSLPVKGFLDVVARRRDSFTREFSEPLILERKTRKDNRAPKPEDRFQGRVYQLVKPLPVEFHITARSNGNATVYEPTLPESAALTVASLRSIVLEMATCYAVYGPDQPWPDRGRLHDWACSYCGFKSTCPYWNPEFWPK